MSKNRGEHSTAWNKNIGVGATLLENWVEERAVGPRIVEERSNIALVSKQGHENILSHVSHQNRNQYRTTTEDTYGTSPIDSRLPTKIGKRRQYLEAALLKQALMEESVPTMDPKEQWKTTTLQDYAHEDIYPPIRELGKTLPPKEKLDQYKNPITFWTDYAAKGSGTAICSTRADLLHKECYPGTEGPATFGHKSGQLHQHDASSKPIMFGKQSKFSTPIQEYKKGECKE
ncbi:hypothetical protein BC833DRAFT_576065 [Globomyces pollinis-pini]|nr:hypothetical protein BC833DRAFT_576065 [Globomyces pollinis-pini]